MHLRSSQRTTFASEALMRRPDWLAELTFSTVCALTSIAWLERSRPCCVRPKAARQCRALVSAPWEWVKEFFKHIVRDRRSPIPLADCESVSLSHQVAAASESLPGCESFLGEAVQSMRQTVNSSLLRTRNCERLPRHRPQCIRWWQPLLERIDAAAATAG